MPTLSRTQIPAAIGECRDFKGSSIEGGRVTPAFADMIMTGRLDPEWRKRLVSDAPRYVVWSYGTPIAWVKADGTAVIPDVKHSVTTSNHQGLAAEGLTGNRKARTSL